MVLNAETIKQMYVGLFLSLFMETVSVAFVQLAHGYILLFLICKLLLFLECNLYVFEARVCESKCVCSFLTYSIIQFS